MKKRTCVVTGIGILSTFGSDLQKYYNSLLQGKSGAQKLDIDVSGFDYVVGAKLNEFCLGDYLDRKRANRVDPAIGYALACAYNVVRDAKLDFDSLDLQRCGCIVGTGIGGMHTATKNFKSAFSRSFAKVSPFFIPHMITNMCGALVAQEFGFMGVNYSISTACATSNYSIINAKRHIEFGDCDVMIAGGVEASMTEASFGGFSALHALSRNITDPTKASRPFDVSRDGFLMGEGAGLFVVEELEHALKRGAHIYGVLSGGAYTCDAHHMTNPLPDGSQVARCLNIALNDAGLQSKDIDYFNAHATATQAGDISEIRAINKVFGGQKDRIKINATKSMIGHALGASGGLELAAILMALQTNKLHPTINLDQVEPELQGYDLITNGYIEKKIDHAINNSIGFGGHNSSIVVSRYKEGSKGSI